MDIDLGTDSSTWNSGNGTLSSEEQKVVTARHLVRECGLAAGRVIRFITSNDDIYDAIHAASPSTPSTTTHPAATRTIFTSTSARPPAQPASPTSRATSTWTTSSTPKITSSGAERRQLMTAASYDTWRANFGKTLLGRAACADSSNQNFSPPQSPNPPPATFVTIFFVIASLQRRPKTISRGALAQFPTARVAAFLRNAIPETPDTTPLTATDQSLQFRPSAKVASKGLRMMLWKSHGARWYLLAFAALAAVVTATLPIYVST